MTVNIVTTQQQDRQVCSTECVSIHLNDSKFLTKEKRTFWGGSLGASISGSGLTANESADERAKQIAREGEYTYVPWGKFVTYKSTGPCCPNYFPTEVDLISRKIEIIAIDEEKTLENARNADIPDGGPPRKLRLIGFDKNSAIQKAIEIAADRGIPFVRPQESTCSIL